VTDEPESKGGTVHAKRGNGEPGEEVLSEMECAARTLSLET